jgi:O-antigen/teichoic acid export membrane protein
VSLKAQLQSLRSAGSLVGTAFAYGLLEVLSRAVQASVILILAHSFGKEEFGEFYSYFCAYQLVTVLGTGGLIETFMSALVKSGGTDDAKEQLARVFVRKYALRSAIAGSAAVAIALVAAQLLKFRIDPTILIVAVAGGGIGGLFTLIGSYKTCIGSNRSAIHLRSLYLICSYGVALVIALSTKRILFFFWGALASGIGLAMFTGLTRWLRHPTASATTASRADHRAEWFLVPSVLNWLLWYGLVLYSAGRFGAQSGAELALSNNIAAAPLMIHASISQAWLSRYLRHRSQSSSAAEAKNATVFRLQSVIILASCLATIAAYEALKALSVPVLIKYGEIGPGIAILLFAQSVSANYFGAINSFAVNDAGRRLATISLIAYGASAAALLALSNAFGIVGVYVGLAALIVSRGYAVTFYAMRRFGGGFFDWRIFAANIVCAGAVAAYYAHRT